MPIALITPVAINAARYATAGLLESLLGYVPRAVTQRILPTTLTKVPRQARELLLKLDFANNQLEFSNNPLENNATQLNNNSLFTLLQERANNNLQNNNIYNLQLGGR